jgi:hypothetical protein
MAPFYWERHPNGPFTTLIQVTTTYLDPENYNPEGLKAFVERENHPKVQTFKSELREAVKDPGKLPGNELSNSVHYDDGSPDAFLHRLWRELYGDEPA